MLTTNLGAACALILLGGTAWADALDPGTAEQHYSLGVELCRQERFEEARDEFRASWEASPDAEVAATWGGLEATLGDPELAASLLTFALLAPEPPEGAESLRRTLDALIEQQVGTVELVGVPVEAIVSVDGQERDPHFLRSPLYLAPGVREVLVTIRGVSWAGSADVRAGETERMEVVLPEVVAQEIAEEPAAARFPRRRSRVAAWMTTGTAIAGFGVGIGGVLSAASRRQDRDRELDAIAGEFPEYERAGICGRGAPDPESCAEARSAFASSRVWTGVGIAGLGTAALGAGLAVILWTQPREDVTIEATGSGARLSVHF